MSARIPLTVRVAGYRTVDFSQLLGHLLDVYEAGPRRVRGGWRFDHHVARCDWCNPMANPRPLSIDGHAYHRRTRARRRRS